MHQEVEPTLQVAASYANGATIAANNEFVVHAGRGVSLFDLNPGAELDCRATVRRAVIRRKILGALHMVRPHGQRPFSGTLSEVTAQQRTRVSTNTVNKTVGQGSFDKTNSCPVLRMTRRKFLSLAKAIVFAKSAGSDAFTA